ncbi:hypothetical protein [Brevibacillus laterosporus]|uniref:hypothetical protein n=1 Tax=Brevibacillus laterosporus TaxID=1465 RepID=UPI000839C7B9|nr:hypothetical protein [Brevibacillus laterosporus]
MKIVSKARYFVTGVIMGAVLFSGVSYAATKLTNIQVQFLNTKIFVDGVNKPLAKGQAIFSYNGFVYVPLSHVTTQHSKPLTYDPKIDAYYIGSTTTQDQAMSKAFDYLKNKTLYDVTKIAVMVDGQDDTNYFVRVFENHPDHIATIMWLNVNKKTGEVMKQDL